MSSRPVPRIAVLLPALLGITRAASIPAIFDRQATCAVQGFSPCGNGLPAGFCCDAGSKCIPLAGGTTVLCCPEGEKCDLILPITCNLSLQDPVANPKAQIKTTALRGKLPACGNECCPFGYTCNAQAQCIISQDQSAKPSEAPASALPSSTPGPSTTLPATAVVPTTIPSSTPSAPPADSQAGNEDDKSFPTTAVVVGILCGVLGGIAVTVAILVWLARRRKRNAAAQSQNHKKGHGLCRTSSSTSSFGHTISDPIPHQDSTLRTDFILKTPSTVASKPPVTPPGRTLSNTARSPQHSPAGTTAINPRTPERGQVFGAPVAPIRTMRSNPSAWIRRPVTPKLQREPSSESINIFADPGTVRAANDKRNTTATTFTDLMDQADLGDVRRGKPFVPGTAIGTPRTPVR